LLIIAAVQGCAGARRGNITALVGVAATQGWLGISASPLVQFPTTTVLLLMLAALHCLPSAGVMGVSAAHAVFIQPNVISIVKTERLNVVFMANPSLINHARKGLVVRGS
jgi:hypothetical protein